MSIYSTNKRTSEQTANKSKPPAPVRRRWRPVIITLLSYARRNCVKVERTAAAGNAREARLCWDGTTPPPHRVSCSFFPLSLALSLSNFHPFDFPWSTKSRGYQPAWPRVHASPGNSFLTLGGECKLHL